MRELIKELSRQAMIFSHENGGWRISTHVPKDFQEKFAELIVQECVAQLELVRKYRYDRVQPLENQETIITECQYQIKQHFGLEP